jgi:hypothetical protein
VDEPRFRPDKTDVPPISSSIGSVEAALNLAFLDAMYHREQLMHAVGRQDGDAAVSAAMTAMGLMLTALCAAHQLVAESPDGQLRRSVRHMLPGMHESRVALIAEIDRLTPQLAAAPSRDLLAGVRRALVLVSDAPGKAA